MLRGLEARHGLHMVCETALSPSASRGAGHIKFIQLTLDLNPSTSSQPESCHVAP